MGEEESESVKKVKEKSTNNDQKLFRVAYHLWFRDWSIDMCVGRVVISFITKTPLDAPFERHHRRNYYWAIEWFNMENNNSNFAIRHLDVLCFQTGPDGLRQPRNYPKSLKVENT